jgi:hypothetical protein
MENTIPILIQLRLMSEDKRSPILKYADIALKVILADYQSDIDQLFAAVNPMMGVEAKSDIERLRLKPEKFSLRRFD